ncbi:YQGE family putative transporter [Fontibacillus phaseoli]|uniref:YQGE family putative transporter n=1 Tax=Fontibacillus phaseoli TaxID=1416533 RepID=A0A369B7Z5_9BACL|nr:MFS transporter [Fontibacillus phaseoli]RCX17435.1 YQGE family putative transporter [Fontibacillus phaseoli]
MKRNLNGQSRLLLAVNGLFVLAGALSGTFLNVYLWKVKQDFAMIGWFTFSQQIALGLTFWIAGKWVKERDKMVSLRLGIVVSGLFYLLVLWAGARTVEYIWPLGFLFGIGSGLFWLAFNVVYFEVTDVDTRDLFNGWIGILGSVIGILGPWTSGVIISVMKGDLGYRVIFTVSLVIYGVGILLSFWLKKRKKGGPYHWLGPFRHFEKDSPWRQAIPASAAHGLREGVFSFLGTLLVFISTSAERKVGQFSLVTSLVSLVSFWAVGKWLHIRYRYVGMLIGAVLITGVIIPLLWNVNYLTLIFFGIGTSLFMPLYLLPVISSVFDLIGKSEDTVEQRVELIVLRELSIMSGRLVGTLLFIIVFGWFPRMTTVTWLMLGLGASPILSWIAIRKLFKPRADAPDTV